MHEGQEMNDAELQQAAREAIEGHTQTQVAEELDLNQSTISLALNHETPSRYAGTLRRIVARYTGYSVETETTTVHRLTAN
jgi:hypothetical protein